MKPQFQRLGLLMDAAARGLVIAAFSLSAVGQSHRSATLCDILKSPKAFDGQQVTISAVEGNSFHQVDFFDPECTLPKHGGALHLRFAEAYKLGQPGDEQYLRLLRKEGAVALTVEGRFVSTGGPFGPEGNDYEFVIASIVSVRKLSKEYRHRFDIGTGKRNAG